MLKSKGSGAAAGKVVGHFLALVMRVGKNEYTQRA